MRRDPKPCNAIANSARIFFGCNPPVTTRTVLAGFPCNDPCDSCLTVVDTLLGPVTIPAGGDSLLNGSDLGPDLYAFLTSNAADWEYKWYPAHGLSDPFVLFPVMTASVRRQYTLVASRSDLCQKVVLRVSVRPAQPLTLNASWTATGGCPDNPIWTLTATAGGAPATNLVWHDCSSGVGAWSDNNLMAQQVYVAVWDTLSGEYVEQWVNLPHNCPLDDPWWPPSAKSLLLALAALLVLSLAGIWLFRRFKRKF